MRGPGPTDPFAALGLLARPGVSDDEVRSAWRRVAAATHPDREDGGDPARFAQAAAAYTVLRTSFGRSEALADLAAAPAQTPARRALRPARSLARPAMRAARSLTRLTGRFTKPSHRRGRVPPGILPGALRAVWLRLSRLRSRIWHGRPVRLALRVLLAGAVGAGTAVIAGARPATPALITGAVTWLALTARHDLAPPPL